MKKKTDVTTTIATPDQGHALHYALLPPEARYLRDALNQLPDQSPRGPDISSVVREVHLVRPIGVHHVDPRRKHGACQ